MVNYSQPSPSSFYSNTFLPSFHFSPATHGPGASRPSAPPLMLCLDIRVHTPEDESGTGSSRGSLRGNTEAPRMNLPGAHVEAPQMTPTLKARTPKEHVRTPRTMPSPLPLREARGASIGTERRAALTLNGLI